MNYKRKYNESYYEYTCRRVAGDLDLSLWDVKLSVRYLFKGMKKILNSYDLLSMRGLFKLILRKRYYINGLMKNLLHKKIIKKNN